MLEEDPAGSLRRLDAVRRPLYEEVADVAIDVDQCPVNEIVDTIVGQLEVGR